MVFALFLGSEPVGAVNYVRQGREKLGDCSPKVPHLWEASCFLLLQVLWDTLSPLLSFLLLPTEHQLLLPLSSLQGGLRSMAYLVVSWGDILHPVTHEPLDPSHLLAIHGLSIPPRLPVSVG